MPCEVDPDNQNATRRGLRLLKPEPKKCQEDEGKLANSTAMPPVLVLKEKPTTVFLQVTDDSNEESNSGEVSGLMHNPSNWN